MDVKLNDDNMKDVIAKAILDTLTPERREELIATAIKDLITVPTGDRFNRSSPLQEAFNTAIRQVANEIAREQIVGNTEIKEKIAQLITDAWGKLVNDENRTNMVDKIAASIERGLIGDRY